MACAPSSVGAFGDCDCAGSCPFEVVEHLALSQQAGSYILDPCTTQTIYRRSRTHIYSVDAGVDYTYGIEFPIRDGIPILYDDGGTRFPGGDPGAVTDYREVVSESATSRVIRYHLFSLAGPVWSTWEITLTLPWTSADSKSEAFGLSASFDLSGPLDGLQHTSEYINETQQDDAGSIGSAELIGEYSAHLRANVPRMSGTGSSNIDRIGFKFTVRKSRAVLHACSACLYVYQIDPCTGNSFDEICSEFVSGIDQEISIDPDSGASPGGQRINPNCAGCP